MPTANNKKRRTTAKSQSKINVSQRPKDMSLEEWQRALRRQVAEKGLFAISAPHIQGESIFKVKSAGSDRVYSVTYFGPQSRFNRCECMDFKTNRLGTCKHIEAISSASSGKYARAKYLLPQHTSVYMDYPAGRKVKIQIGDIEREQMEEFARTLFDSNLELIDKECDPSGFIRMARKLDPGFNWEPDALNYIIDCRDKAKRKALVAEKYRDTDFKGLLHTTLHPYQADGVRFAFTEGRTINADEMGLGKTVQAIATAELLRKEGLISSVIIICPTSLKYQWLAEIKRFTDSSAHVIEGDAIKRKEQFSDTSWFYKIVSFHAMSNTIKSQTIPQADLIIYDELQRLKNKDTKMGKQLRKLKSQYVMALSGTPLENKLDELYSVTQLVDQFILGPYYKFTAETTVNDDAGKIIGYKNLHEVAERLSRTLIRRRKADVRLQMPARTDKILYVPMTKEQQAIHDEYKFQVGIIINKWRRHKFLSEADRKRLLLFLSMMRMVCDSTYILDQKSRHDTKIDEIMAIISTMIEEGDGKVVIFSQWERMLRILATELTDKGHDFCFLHGGVPSIKRKDLIDRFRDDPDCRIFLSTDAGATGLNLQTAALLINIDLPWNPAVLEQRIARIYRLGQTNPVQIINMVAKDTIEERMLSTLKFKSNLAAGILDGGEDAVFFENSKFDKIVETVESVIYESPSEEQAPVSQQNMPSAEQNTPPAVNQEPASHTGSRIPANPHPLTKDAGSDDRETTGTTSKSQDEMRHLLAGGIAALGKLANALRDPHSVKSLADAIVREDPTTGETMLNIPVPDKNTVINLISAFSSLLNR